MVEKIQRVEGLAIGLAVLYFYGHVEASWLLFLALFLVPDISMLGYLNGSKKLGAQIYNFGHSLVLPVMLLVLAVSVDYFVGAEVALIWLAHIGFDRATGYGLKKDDNFQHTHLGWVGKKSIVSRSKDE